MGNFLKASNYGAFKGACLVKPYLSNSLFPIGDFLKASNYGAYKGACLVKPTRDQKSV